MELFPEFKYDVLPPLRVFKYQPEKQSINLRRIVNDTMTGFDNKTTLVARNHVIIGWKQKDVIRLQSNLFGETNNIFDTIKKKFVTLNSQELWRVGVNRRFTYVFEKEEADAVIRAKHPAILQTIQ